MCEHYRLSLLEYLPESKHIFKNVCESARESKDQPHDMSVASNFTLTLEILEALATMPDLHILFLDLSQDPLKQEKIKENVKPKKKSYCYLATKQRNDVK